jgi:hypothetical protein
MNKNQQGSSSIILVVLAVILIAAATGFVFWQRMMTAKPAGGKADQTASREDARPVVPEGWKEYYTPYWSVGFAAPDSEPVGASMQAGPVSKDSLDGIIGTPIGLSYDPVKREMVEYDYANFDFSNKVPRQRTYLHKADSKVMDRCDASYYDTDFKQYPSPFQDEGEPVPSDYTGVIVFCDHPTKPYMLEYEFKNLYSKDMVEKFFKTIVINEDEVIKG